MTRVETVWLPGDEPARRVPRTDDPQVMPEPSRREPGWTPERGDTVSIGRPVICDQRHNRVGHVSRVKRRHNGWCALVSYVDPGDNAWVPVADLWPVSDAEVRAWQAYLSQQRVAVRDQLAAGAPQREPTEVRLARRDLARADALLASAIRVYSTWQSMSDPPVEDSGQFGLFEAGDAA